MKKSELLKMLESLKDDDDCSKILEASKPPQSEPPNPEPPKSDPPKAEDKVTMTAAEMLRLFEDFKKKDDKKKIEEDNDDAQIFI